MKQLVVVFSVAIMMILQGCNATSPKQPENPAHIQSPLYQISTIDALLSGLFDGSHTVRDVREHGDFGLGTFDGIDGEMVMLHGEVYQVKSDGSIIVADEQMGVPFASVHFFHSSDSRAVSSLGSYAQLKTALDGYGQCRNYPCAFKLTGRFAYVKTRSAPKATKPYPELAEHISKKQNFFIADDVEGTLIGYKLPDYFEMFNVPGYHFHFLSHDRSFGGHVLEVQIESAVLKVQRLNDIEVSLLRTEAFEKSDLESSDDALDIVEH